MASLTEHLLPAASLTAFGFLNRASSDPSNAFSRHDEAVPPLQPPQTEARPAHASHRIVGTLMLHSEQDGWHAFSGVHDVSEPGRESGRPLMELAREIEETQRRQSSTLKHIVQRLRDLDLTPSSGQAGEPAQPEAHAGPPSQEPWDRASAEALMLTYENAHASDAEEAQRAQAEPRGQGWFGQPLHDVTQRIKRTLHDLRPGATVAFLEERLDQFQHQINLALEDVVRRGDLEGLHRIEEHLSDLGEQLHALELHVQRLDGVEADLRTVLEQVSDERLAKLLDYNARFSADLDVVATRAAEEVHVRFGREAEAAGARRHEELCALIEASIQDRRQAETQASTLVADLSGQVSAQSDRYGEIKALLEETRREQRENEQTAIGMLDTLQQALVRVLDRIDALEQQALSEPVEPEEPAARQPPPPPPAQAELATAPCAADNFAPVDTDAISFVDHSEAESHALAPLAEVPAAFVQPGETATTPEEDSEPTIERLRRDFIADARRAKMKAAANRAEDNIAKSELLRRAEAGEPAQTSPARRSVTGGGRLFGSSPRLLAGVLALIVAINGALLLFTRKESPAPQIPEIHVPAAGVSGHQAGDADEDADVPEKSSSLGTPGMVTPYGDLDDVLNPPQIDPTRDASAPLGTTIVSTAATQQEEGAANVYEQQMLAGLSRQLGAIAAEQTPDAMLPESRGRFASFVETAATDALPPEADSAGASALDLPPATVGPLSLRLAAANGDASAEFEVGARLAAGKGTSQDFAEAARWYQRSASKGFAQSQYRLGTLYERGLGVAKDLGRARVWYGRAAEQGNVKAMHNLAVLAAGNAAAPDYPTALRWFTAAAEHGLADSQFNLGVVYENGLGVAADRIQAYKWYALAANGGDADAKSMSAALKAKMSADERGKAERLIAAFKARLPNRLANDALAAGEDWKRRAEAGPNT